VGTQTLTLSDGLLVTGSCPCAWTGGPSKSSCWRCARRCCSHRPTDAPASSPHNIFNSGSRLILAPVRFVFGSCGGGVMLSCDLHYTAFFGVDVPFAVSKVAERPRIFNRFLAGACRSGEWQTSRGAVKNPGSQMGDLEARGKSPQMAIFIFVRCSSERIQQRNFTGRMCVSLGGALWQNLSPVVPSSLPLTSGRGPRHLLHGRRRCPDA